MKNATVNILSEIFMFALGLGIMIIMVPEIPLTTAFIGAIVIYMVSALISTVLWLLIEFLTRAYYNRKYSKDE